MTPQTGDPEVGKAALAMASEFVHYTLALSTGALVFSANLARENPSLRRSAKYLLVGSWGLLSLSVIGGVMALSRLPVMLSEEIYDIFDPWFTVPGQVHQIAFLLGMTCLGMALVQTVLAHPAASEAEAGTRG